MRKCILASVIALLSLGAVNPHEHDYFFHRRQLPADGGVTHHLVTPGRPAYIIIREVRIGKVPMTLWAVRQNGVREELIVLDEDFISGVGIPIKPGEGFGYTVCNAGQRVSIICTVHP